MIRHNRTFLLNPSFIKKTFDDTRVSEALVVYLQIVEIVENMYFYLEVAVGVHKNLCVIVLRVFIELMI